MGYGAIYHHQRNRRRTVMMHHHSDSIGTAMESDNEMMPPAARRESWTTGSSYCGTLSARARVEEMEETEATATTMPTVRKDLTVRDGMNVIVYWQTVGARRAAVQRFHM